MTTPAPHEGRAVQAMLGAKGWTQSDLAHKLEIDKGTLSRLLNGRADRPSQHRRAHLWRQVWLTLVADGDEAK